MTAFSKRASDYARQLGWRTAGSLVSVFSHLGSAKPRSETGILKLAKKHGWRELKEGSSRFPRYHLVGFREGVPIMEKTGEDPAALDDFFSLPLQIRSYLAILGISDRSILADLQLPELSFKIGPEYAQVMLDLNQHVKLGCYDVDTLTPALIASDELGIERFRSLSKRAMSGLIAEKATTPDRIGALSIRNIARIGEKTAVEINSKYDLKGYPRGTLSFDKGRPVASCVPARCIKCGEAKSEFVELTAGLSTCRCGTLYGDNTLSRKLDEVSGSQLEVGAVNIIRERLNLTRELKS